MKNADYRKYNDRSLNSSTYHKKDGTPIRAILKKETMKELNDVLSDEEVLRKQGFCFIRKQQNTYTAQYDKTTYRGLYVDGNVVRQKFEDIFN